MPLEKMRVVFLAPFALYPKSTVSLRALPLARALARRGHDVTLLIPPWDNPPDAGKAWRDEGVDIVHVSLAPRIPLLWYGVVTWRLLRQALTRDPDVYHAFKPKGFSGLAAMLLWLMKLLGLLRGKLVVDTDDWEGQGGWNELGDYPWWQRAFFSFQERWLLRHLDRVTVASRTLEELAVGLRGTRRGVQYLPNGVSEDAPLPRVEVGREVRRRYGFAQAAVLLLYTRFFEFSLDRLLEIVRQVVVRAGEAKLLVVGKGFWGEEATLEQKAQALGLDSHVVQVGWVAPHELEGFFAAADVALYPMDDTLLNRAKCPAKLLELLSAAVPVVAERVGQVGEYITSEESGILVEPGDTAACAEAVLRLLKDKAMRKRLGAAARARVLEAYPWSRLAEQLEQAYQP